MKSWEECDLEEVMWNSEIFIFMEVNQQIVHHINKSRNNETNILFRSGEVITRITQTRSG